MPETVVVTDIRPGRRRHEPVTFTVDRELGAELWRARADTGEELLCQRLATPNEAGRTSFVTVLNFEKQIRFSLLEPVDATPAGIQRGRPQELDGFVRLNTGYFDLELCTGTAQGTGAAKWGLRHFRSLRDGLDLLPSGDNAIGGFYGPFFTPENGLINPPEHTTVDIEVLETGPLLHHYRMHGTVPDGLLDELRGKRFSIDWWFTYGTPYFRRRYHVDNFSTVVNGRAVTNKITVGDEFESGRGQTVFDRFETYSGTHYRAGDPYAEELASMVHNTLATSDSESPKFKDFREQLTSSIDAAHWDLYWRLFSVWEGALKPTEIQRRLARVRAAAHVRADLPERQWISARDPIEPAAAPDQTIFAGPAAKTAEFDSASGRAMIWWTSAPSGAFQIVQRPRSGWVNWGTNSENECPELPVGVEIKTAYGLFASTWRQVADQLECPPEVHVQPAAS